MGEHVACFFEETAVVEQLWTSREDDESEEREEERQFDRTKGFDEGRHDSQQWK